MVELLEERPADALHRASAHLSLDEHRVERAADVLCDDVPQHRHLARLAVDAHVREVHGHRRRTARLRRSPEPLDRLTAPAEAERLRRYFLHRDRAVGHAHGRDAVDHLEVARRDLQLLRAAAVSLALPRPRAGQPGRRYR